MDELEVARAKQAFMDAQKRFVDTEHTLNTAHDAFLTSCQELTVAEKNLANLLARNLANLTLMDSNPPLSVHAEGA